MTKEEKKEYNKKYREKNKDLKKQSDREYYEKNINSIREYQKKWRENNQQYIKEYKKKWGKENYLKNKEKRKEYYKLWYERNKDNSEYKSKIQKTNKKCRSKKPHLTAWRNVLKNSLIRLKNNKIDTTVTLLKYSALQLKQRVECQFKEGMSWENYGEWHIDHKKPISRFNPKTPIHIVNALSNLQPLWAKDNLSKKNSFKSVSDNTD